MTGLSHLLIKVLFINTELYFFHGTFHKLYTLLAYKFLRWQRLYAQHFIYV